MSETMSDKIAAMYGQYRNTPATICTNAYTDDINVDTDNYPFMKMALLKKWDNE